MNQRTTAFCALLSLPLFSLALFSQTMVEFEVASILAAAPITSSQQVNAGVKIDDAHVRFQYLSLRDYICMAYKVKIHQVSGPDWLASERFDIKATMPEGSKRDQMAEMMQALLADRFKMKQHKSSKEFPVYQLVIAKGGLKIEEAAPAEDVAEASKKPVEVQATGGPAGSTFNYGNGSTFSFGDDKFQGTKLTMAQIAETLARFVDRPIVDMTGLKGRYNFTLPLQHDDYMAMMIRSAVTAGVALPSQALALMDRGSGDSLPNALQVLGLKMERGKAPIEVVVVDEIQKIPTEN